MDRTQASTGRATASVPHHEGQIGLKADPSAGIRWLAAELPKERGVGGLFGSGELGDLSRSSMGLIRLLQLGKRGLE